MRPAFLAVALLLAPGASRAGLFPLGTASTGSVPSLINYSGTLTDNGTPLNGTRSMTFRIYDAAAAGNLLWSGSAPAVSFDQGYFNAVLSVSTSAFARGVPLYMEVQVDSVVLSPRDPLQAYAYALVAKTVEGSLDVAGGGLSVSSFSSLSVSSRTGNVGIGASDPQSALDVRGVLGGGGSSGLTFTASGNVGIGVASPGSVATVAGDIRLSGAVVFPDSTQQTSALVLGTPSSITAAGSVAVVGDAGGTGAGDAVLQTGAAPADRLRAFNGGNVGIGSSNPAAKLHLSSGTLLVDGTLPGLSVASTLYVSSGQAGIGVSSAAATLEAAGAAQFGAGAFKSTITAAGNLQLVAGSTISGHGTLTFSTASLTSVPGLYLDAAGRLGVGTGSPGALLDVNAAARFGASGRSAFDAGGNLALVSGSTVSSQGTLSISTAATAGTTGVPALFLDAGGRAGVGTAAPGAQFEVASSTGAWLRKTAGRAGSVGLAAVKGSAGKTGVQVCGTGQCLAHWESTGLALGCAGTATTVSRALCAGYGD